MGLVLAVLEGSLLFAAVAATTLWATRPLLLDWIDASALLAQAAVPTVCAIVAFYYNDFYDLKIVRSFADFASRLLTSFGLTFILLGAFYSVVPDARIAQGPFIWSFLIVVGLLLPLRAGSYAIMRSRPFVERVLIVGTSSLARKLVAEIEASPHFRYTIAGIAEDARTADDPAWGYPVLGPLEHLAKIIEELTPDRIVVALSERRGRMPVRELLDAQMRGLLVEEGVEVYERLTGKVAIDALSPSSLIFSRAFRKSRVQLGLRRLVSLLAAAAGLALTAPLMALIAAAIRLDSRGPVFFVQPRAGLAGREFNLYKFRTMHEPTGDETGAVWDRDDSARITRVGRWVRLLRWDELPQFWNILRGDMDIVGPRPEIACNVKTMSQHIPYYSLRHGVRPGITGWAQIKHGYSVTLEDVTEKMRYDLYYVKNMSLALDLRILVDTVKIMLFGRGAQ